MATPSDLDDDGAFAGAVVEADEADLLPAAQAQFAILDGEDQRGAQEAGAHVGVAVDVGVGDVVLVVLVGRDYPVEEIGEILHYPGLELECGDGPGRSRERTQ